MINFSFGRALRSSSHACAHSISATARPVTPCLATTIARSYSNRPTHQRRHSSSSSKPPSAAGGSSGNIPQTPDAQQSSSARRTEGEKKSVPRYGRRKKDVATATTETMAKETVVKARDELFANAPSVPSTHHLHPADIAVSAFFSLHRPISVTSTVPSTHTVESFSAIFNPRIKDNGTQRRNHADVISTLTSAVHSLEAATANPADERNPDINSSAQEEQELRAALAAATGPNSETKHLDARPQQHHQIQNSPLQFPSHVLSGLSYKPFSPPPPPVPMSSRHEAGTQEAEAAEAEADAEFRRNGFFNPNNLPSATLKKSYSSILKITETVNASGEKKYIATVSAPIVEESNGESVEPERRIGVWQALSTRRKRRLKMKKHKLKKLMKRTRNVRRKLDRL